MRELRPGAGEIAVLGRRPPRSRGALGASGWLPGVRRAGPRSPECRASESVAASSLPWFRKVLFVASLWGVFRFQRGSRPVPPCRSDCERPTRRGHARAMHRPAAHEPLPRVSVPIPASTRTLVPSWFTELEPTAREPRPRPECSCSLGHSESRVSVCSQGPGSVSLCRGLPGPGRKGAELVAAAAPPVGLSSVVAVLQCPWCFSPAERCMFP